MKSKMKEGLRTSKQKTEGVAENVAEEVGVVKCGGGELQNRWVCFCLSG